MGAGCGEGVRCGPWARGNLTPKSWIWGVGSKGRAVEWQRVREVGEGTWWVHAAAESRQRWVDAGGGASGMLIIAQP